MRGRDVDWALEPDSSDQYSWAQVHAGILMDIRDQLKLLNARLSCSNLGRMQRTLDRISRHVARLPKRRKPHAPKDRP